MITEGHGRIYVDRNGELQYEYQGRQVKKPGWAYKLLDAVRYDRDFVQWERSHIKPPWAIDAGCD